MANKKIQLYSDYLKKNIFVFVGIVLIAWLVTAYISATQPISMPPTAGGQPTPAPKRLNLVAGAASATVKGDLYASGSDLYVLRAIGGQTMTVELSFTEGQASLVIWEKGRTILFSDHAAGTDFRHVLDPAGVIHFQGVLPSTQDYFILLKGRPDGSTSYSMRVSIPPLPSN